MLLKSSQTQNYTSLSVRCYNLTHFQPLSLAQRTSIAIKQKIHRSGTPVIIEILEKRIMKPIIPHRTQKKLKTNTFFSRQAWDTAWLASKTVLHNFCQTPSNEELLPVKNGARHIIDDEKINLRSRKFMDSLLFLVRQHLRWRCLMIETDEPLQN